MDAIEIAILVVVLLNFCLTIWILQSVRKRDRPRPSPVPPLSLRV